jgi:hypothetical protein
MRKLPRVSAAAAAVAAVTVTAGAFTFRPAAGSVPAPAAGPGSGPAQMRSGGPAQMRSGGPAQMRSGGPAQVRPGGPAILARGRHLPPGSGLVTTDLTSLNWGGYAAARPGVRFRYVQSVFFVPYVDCGATPDAQSAHWVGLDGLHNNTVEQTGISADCSAGSPSYRAWYEMVPNPPVFQGIRIRPGDAIVASVYYSHRERTFTLSLTDATNGHHFSHTAACPAGATCPRSAAEAISEPPLGPTGYLPLADFRAEAYSGARVTDAGGHRGGLRSPHWDTVKITTINSSGATLDQPTALHAGSAFGTYWLRAG